MRRPSVLPPSLALVLSMTAAAPAQSIRNDQPQRPSAPIRHVDPLYCPWPAGDDPAPAVDTAAETPEALLARLRELHTTLRHEAALEVADRLVERLPDHPLGHYNRACVLSRLRRIDEALASLDRAVDHGWRNIPHLRLDPDLHVVRAEPRFADLLERIAALDAQERGRWRLPGRDGGSGLAPAVQGLLERGRVPGLAIAIVRDGRITWSGGFGVTDARTAAPVRDATRFDAPPLESLLTVLAAVREHAAGRLDVGALLADATPSVPGSVRTVGHRAAPATRGVALEARLRSAIALASGAPLRADWPADDGPEVAVGHHVLGTPLNPAPAGGVAAPAVALLIAEAHGGAGDVAVELARLGVGCTLDSTAGTPTLESAAEAGGAGCLVRWAPTRGEAVVVLYNRAGASGVAREVARMALGE